MAKAVLFDFSGTLFHCESAESWLRAALDQAGITASDAEVEVWAERLHASGGQAGAYSEFAVPAHLTDLWARRDLTAEDHRAAYTALVETAELPWPGLADILYDRHYAPEAWDAYPDTVAVLELLQKRDMPVAVVSNIGWDLRTVFKHFGVDHLIADYVLSYEVGVKKPDAGIFELACEAVGCAPADVLMVGDNAVADGGATAIGCSFELVEHAPVAARPRALLDAVRA
ncbi:HAD-IA family hydrolase [Actinocrinis sp.]|uniref:HAD family hydrolase n=1 Tax=Actinocrinis sp. TaxID=1920516 RepID=UPI002D676865|nr:HAD-IA family hydrolase [Actinocrinis sp.]HZP52405.1 HAD-IA family hydrolase [Actinocrinis sp.]